jgi:hypothetical protein
MKELNQQIIGPYLVATIAKINKKFSFLSKSKESYQLIFDYDVPEVSFSLNLDKETLNRLADFIKECVENN